MKDRVQQQGKSKQWISILAVVGLVITVGIVAGTYWLGKSNGPKPLPKPPELPRNVNQRISGLTFTRSDKGQRLFVIHAARTLAFKHGGSTLLQDVDVEFFGKSGKRYDLLKTPKAEYNPATGNLSTPGDVELILNASRKQVESLLPRRSRFANAAPAANVAGKPVYITTSKVSSQDHGTLLESTTPVSFHLGSVSGSARGLAYDTSKGDIILKQDVKAAFQPAQDPTPSSPIQLTASRLLYGGAGKAVQLWGPVGVRQGSRTVSAQQGTLTLDPQNRVTEVVLQGQAHAADETSGGKLSLQSDEMRGRLDPATNRLSKLVAAGHVQGMSTQGGAVTNLKAHEVVLNFSSATHVPSNGAAMGEVHLTIAQLDGDRAAAGLQTPGGRISKEDLSTARLEFSFRPSGKNLKEAETAGPGTLVLYPESPKAGDRTVTAAKFLMAFSPTSHLESLRGVGGTQITFAPPPSASGQAAAVASAKEMLATFEPATEMIQSVVQKGDFHFRNGTLKATGEEAQDLAPQQKLILTGHPEVWDSSTSARADQIVILLASDTAEGIGNVHAIHTDPKDSSTLPTNVIADRMVADHRSQVVHYEGHVRAWRGTDVVESPTLNVYKDQRRVSTNSPVTTSHLQPASSSSGRGEKGQSSPRPLTIRADRLEYFDVGHKARYSGHVVLNTDGTKIESDRLDVYFSPGKKQGDSEVERAVAEGHVKIVQPMRYAKGEHAVYNAKAGTVIMTGGPPKVYDAEKGFMSGQQLTFHIHNNKLLVQGDASSPTVSEHRVAQ